MEISMERRAYEVFAPGVKLVHIYDFGTSSETNISVVGTRTGSALTARPLVLMARNEMPEARCMECDKPAALLCMECLIEEDTWGTLCEAHGKSHPHEDVGVPLPLVNSPRLGMCGYDGPAKPPY